MYQQRSAGTLTARDSVPCAPSRGRPDEELIDRPVGSPLAFIEDFTAVGTGTASVCATHLERRSAALLAGHDSYRLAVGVH